MPRIKDRDANLTRLRVYDRGMLRSAFVSLFWGVISSKKGRGDFTLSKLAQVLGIDKSAFSRWFGGRTRPNWQIDTIADIAHVLDLEIEIIARDRTTGISYTPAGQVETHEASAGLDNSQPRIIRIGSGDMTSAPCLYGSFGNPGSNQIAAAA
jgi:transcriptional regulator with XRE-family HTH domain